MEHIPETQQRLIDDELTKALVSAGIGREFVPATRAMLAPMVKCIPEERPQYRVVADTDLGEQPVAAFVERWARSDEGKPFVRGAGATGSNGGRNEPNPFSADAWNVTEQGQVVKADAAKAERLAKAAGTTVGGSRPIRRAA